MKRRPKTAGAICRPIIAAIADCYGTSRLAIMGRKRSSDAMARKAAYWCCRALNPGMSWPVLGSVFGRDHTTVMHGAADFESKTTTLLRTRLLLRCAWWPEPYVPMPRGQMARLRAEVEGIAAE